MIRRLLLVIALLLGGGITSQAHDALIPIWRIVFGANASYFLSPSGFYLPGPPFTVTNKNYFFLHYWFNSTTDPSSTNNLQHVIFAAQDTAGGSIESIFVTHVYSIDTGTTYLNVHFSHDASAEFIDYATAGDCQIQYDGFWHEVFISVNTDDLTQPNGSLGMINYDGRTCTLVWTGSAPEGGELTAAFQIDWPAFDSYSFANDISATNGFRGTLAEILLDNADLHYLTGSTLSVFRSNPGGKAVGLGENCLEPFEYLPLFCLRGSPLHMDFGPFFGGVPLYILHPLGTNLPLPALGDPCNIPGFGPGCL